MFFAEGGPVMILTALFGFLLAGASVLTLLRPARYWAVTSVLAVVTLASGMLGVSLGLIVTCRYVAHGSEEPVTGARILLQGVAESLNNAVLALAIVVVSLLVCAVAAWRTTRVTSAT
jgi:hypothetical protein